MSIVAGDQPLPRRGRLKKMMPHRYRAALLRKVKATAPLPRRVGSLKNPAATRDRGTGSGSAAMDISAITLKMKFFNIVSIVYQ